MEFVGRVWAIRSEVAEHLRARLELGGVAAARGELPGPMAGRSLEASLMAVSDPPDGGSGGALRGGSVAVIPIFGTITQHGGYWGTSLDGLVAAIARALADQDVRALVFNVDSPGGEVYGLTEAAKLIREAGRMKPIVSAVNSLAASAAFWVAAQATELLIPPSGEAGSVGIYGMHVDMSAALEKEGFKVRMISAPKGGAKTEGNPYEPLSDEAAAAMQEAVDRYYAMFLADLAAGRKKPSKDVEANFGQGRVVGAKDAVARGMADGLGTLADAIRRANALAVARRRSTAALQEAQAISARLGLP